jgi:hypothetical protein
MAIDSHASYSQFTAYNDLKQQREQQYNVTTSCTIHVIPAFTAQRKVSALSRSTALIRVYMHTYIYRLMITVSSHLY